MGRVLGSRLLLGAGDWRSLGDDGQGRPLGRVLKPRLLPGAGDWRSLEDDGQGRPSGWVWISRRLQVGCEAVATQVANVPSVCQAVDVWPFRTGACVRPLRSHVSICVQTHRFTNVRAATRSTGTRSLSKCKQSRANRLPSSYTVIAEGCACSFQCERVPHTFDSTVLLLP